MLNSRFGLNSVSKANLFSTDHRYPGQTSLRPQAGGRFIQPNEMPVNKLPNYELLGLYEDMILQLLAASCVPAYCQAFSCHPVVPGAIPGESMTDMWRTKL
jgi:hypothetical protein